jgi:RNA polymerase sigma factor (TIGR02999 family)
MSGKDETVFVDHARFMAYAARVMRGLIIDDVRRRRSEKRGGLFDITSLGADDSISVMTPQALVLISDALDELAEAEPDLAEIVDLKFFCGFSFAEIGAMRGVSERTIQRSWEKGRLYLHHAIGADAAGTSAHAADQP